MVRALISVGLLMMLLLLRLESERFAAAEYDEPGNRFHRGFWTRLAWYSLGLLFLIGIYNVHPSPRDVLYLVGGHRTDILLYGLALAGVGIAQAAAFAWLRYGCLRFPTPMAYPGAAINSVATAILDEAVFRGALLGVTVVLGFPPAIAILVETIVYVLVTRAAAPGRHPYVFVLAAGLGLAGGWVTLATGGIGAAILGHSVTSFAVFVFTGHAGQVTRSGLEPEEIEWLRRPPVGWQEVPRTGVSLRPAPAGQVPRTLVGHGAEPRGMDDQAARVQLASRMALAEPRNLELLRSLPPAASLAEPQNLFPLEPEAPEPEAPEPEALEPEAVELEPEAVEPEPEAVEPEPEAVEPEPEAVEPEAVEVAADAAAAAAPPTVSPPSARRAAFELTLGRVGSALRRTRAGLEPAGLTRRGQPAQRLPAPTRGATPRPRAAARSSAPITLTERLRGIVGESLTRIDPARRAGATDPPPAITSKNAGTKAAKPGRGQDGRGSSGRDRLRPTLRESGKDDRAAAEHATRPAGGGSRSAKFAPHAQPGPPAKTSRHATTHSAGRAASDPRRHPPGE